MSISYGALAGLIAAVAFLILVLFTLPLIVRVTKTMKKLTQLWTALIRLLMI